MFCLFITDVIHSDKFPTSKFEPVLEVAKSCLQSELVPRQYTLQGDTAY